MDENGFLSTELDKFKEIIKGKFPDHYNNAIEVNSYAQSLQYKIEINKNYTENGIQINTDYLLSAILYSRTISSYQAFLLVSQRGMAQQTKMLLRCMFESLFPLVAIQKNKNYSQLLIESDECDRLKAFNKIIRYRTRQNPNDSSIAKVQDLANASKKKIKENSLRKIGVVDSAEKAGLVDWYDTAYSKLSWTVHASIRSLEETLDLDNSNDISFLKNEPEIEEFDFLYATAIEVILFAVIAIGEIHKIDVSNFASKMHTVVGELLKEEG